MTSCGKSTLSTDPRSPYVLKSMIPDSRARYFDALSTLVWFCSAILASASSWFASSFVDAVFC